MTEQLKNILIGFFIIAASSLLIWMLLFLRPSIGDGDQKLIVRFSNISQLGLGTRVTLSGKPVGQVTEIHLIPNARMEGKVDKQGDPYIFQLTLSIDSHLKVYSTDKINIQTTGLLGEKSITIVPEVVPKETPSHLVKQGEILYAQSYGALESILFEMQKVSLSIGEALESFLHLITISTPDAISTISSMKAVLGNLNDVFDEVKQKQMVTEASRILENLGNITDSIDPKEIQKILKNSSTFSNALANSSENFKNTMQNTKELAIEGKEALTKISQIIEKIAEGKGSLSKFIESDDFYLKVTAVINKVNTLMNDVNHYGILFHLNKGWQRQRERKIKQLHRLNSPQALSSYLNHELDAISTSLARIHILLDKASSDGDKEKILHSHTFQKDYLHLLEQVNHLGEVLKTQSREINK